MKHLSIFMIIIGLVFFSLNYVYAGEESSENQNKDFKLVIVDFIDDSNMQKAGAEIGDILILYNNEKVHSIKHLGILKEAVQTEEVEVFVLRRDKKIKLIIPKGKMGIHIKEYAPDHKMDENAVIIEGIGKLEWGIGMENSFLAAVYRIDEKYGNNLSYTDIIGLSGYGFRTLFFDKWCPSSPDATCGFDSGAEILKKLGYETEYFFLKNEQFEEMGIPTKSKDEILKIILKSIDRGWPVIAIDLIDVPEWGIITGYQKEGKELFCRTYFDRTQRYEIAQKFPWVICVIKKKENVDILPGYQKSILLAKKLYNTEKYENYFSGIRALDEWIIALQDNEYLNSIEDEEMQEVWMANWWIYYSLFEARKIAQQYLLDNKEKFDIEVELIDQLTELYAKETKIMEDGFAFVPSPYNEKFSEWNEETRAKQFEVMKTLLQVENEVNDILLKIE